jgi:hypothetical protein
MYIWCGYRNTYALDRGFGWNNCLEAVRTTLARVTDIQNGGV